MEIQGEKMLAVSRNEVWRALNDPAVLQRCLAGCDTFEPDGEPNRYRVALQASVGPVRARFAGKLQLRDVVAPSSYALAFEGSGGVAGFGKGTARVALEDAGAGTLLRYAAQAQVGGRLAQVGARLIDGVTKRMADDFFGQFVHELGGPQGAARTDSSVQEAVVAAEAGAVAVAVPQRAPAGVPQVQPSSTPSPQSTQIAVVAAAVAATAAAVAVLAVVVVVQMAR